MKIPFVSKIFLLGFSVQTGQNLSATLFLCVLSDFNLLQR